MRWTRRGRSRHLEDRRFDRPRMRMRIPGGRPATGLGCGGIVLLIVLAFVFGPEKILQLLDSGGGGGLPGPPAGSAPVGSSSAEEEELVDFVSFVLDDVQEVWVRLLPQYGSGYRPARLVLFRDAVDSACGFARAATGPFYCPGDERVYIDLGFYTDLRRRFGAPGDFTHGTSAQRVAWVRRGLESGDPTTCDTFGAVR